MLSQGSAKGGFAAVKRQKHARIEESGNDGIALEHGGAEDRTIVVSGMKVSERVDIGGRRIITKKKFYICINRQNNTDTNIINTQTNLTCHNCDTSTK